MAEAGSTAWDVDYVRSLFPAFAHPESRKVAFFENAGGTYVPATVIDRLNQYLVAEKVQPYGPYALSKSGTEAIEQATVGMAELINAGEDEVVIGHCTTMNLYVLSMALRRQFRPGDEIIVTQQEHESNVSPWLRLQAFGVKVRFWPISASTGALDFEWLDEHLNERTRLLCMTHSSNIVGDLNPVKAVARRIHAVGGWLLVDGVSYAPHHAIDVKALDVDIYVLSLYKLFGPHLGLMYVRGDLHERLDNQSLEQLPRLYEAYRRPGSPNYLRIALNPGLVNHEEVASLNGLIAYFEDLHAHHGLPQKETLHQRVADIMTLAARHESVLARRWGDWLRQQDRLELIGADESEVERRSPTWALKCHGVSPERLALALGERDVAVQSGSFYAWRCLEALGIDPATGVLRVSLAHFNTASEIDRLTDALESGLRGL